MSKTLINYNEELKHFIKDNKKNYAFTNYKKKIFREDKENIMNESDNIINILEVSSALKKRKINNRLNNIKVDKKEYNKDGKKTKFNLYKDKDLGLNIYDKQIKILDSEEDYESDEKIIMDGKIKTREDLSEALKIFNKKKFEEINNFSKYCKYKNKI